MHPPSLPLRPIAQGPRYGRRPARPVAACDTARCSRYKLVQGKPAAFWQRLLTAWWLAVTTGFVVPVAHADCRPTDGASADMHPRFEALAPGVWLVPGADGDSNADNRGQVSNLVLAFDGSRTWLLGSGPSPAFGHRLSCAVQARFGRVVTDSVSPWPRPELVLGLAGLPAVGAWAHADVAQALRSRCPGCVERLRQRLGHAAADLGDDPVRVPDRLLTGRTGTLGPWRWWLLSRGDGFPVTVWQHRASGVLFAPGLLWGTGVPDGRDADLQALATSTGALAALPLQRRGAAAPSWVGEQGPPLTADTVTRHVRYWQWLSGAADAGIELGDDGTRTPPLPTDLAPFGDSPRHTLNWQRAWRQAESRWLQRSLR